MNGKHPYEPAEIASVSGKIPLARPGVADPAAVGRAVEAILRSGILTNGSYVRRLEERAAEYLEVRHCVAVSSCTSGLMLVLRAAELTGEVIVPSFTFAATAHAVDWNGLSPVFADVSADTLTLSPNAVEAAIGMRTSAILATHLYGTPCDVEGLAELADRHGVRLFFDAAHAFGSRHAGRMVGGFGDAEVAVFCVSAQAVGFKIFFAVMADGDALLRPRFPGRFRLCHRNVPCLGLDGLAG